MPLRSFAVQPLMPLIHPCTALVLQSVPASRRVFLHSPVRPCHTHNPVLSRGLSQLEPLHKLELPFWLASRLHQFDHVTIEMPEMSARPSVSRRVKAMIARRPSARDPVPVSGIAS